MFEHPQVTGATEYVLEVCSASAKGRPFERTVVSIKDSSTATMLNGFEFGGKYLWRYAGVVNGKTLDWKGPFRFEILNDALVDTNHLRVRIIDSDPSCGAGLAALDMARIVIDRHGKAVWFLPVDSAALNQPGQIPVVNDLRISATGTFTFLNGNNAEERDLNGRLLWRAPKPVSSMNSNRGSLLPAEGYTHCFKKLATGNYMAAAGAISFTPATALGIAADGDDTSRVMMAYDVLKEFDPSGKLVWSWSSEKYFNAGELKAMVLSSPDKGILNPIPGGHMNAFDVDEKNGFVYAGFRNVSRVIKIDKKDGKVVCAWGPGMPNLAGEGGHGFFSKQHETALLHDGSIAVFNNNAPAMGAALPATKLNRAEPVGARPTPGGNPLQPSGVVIFSQPSDSGDSKVVWKYDCQLDPINNNSLRGGSVDELKSGNLLISMGVANHVFEITRDKRIMWSSVIEKFETRDSSWKAFGLFKASDASSLYPCYFTMQTSADILNGSDHSFNLRIFNDGTEDDSYVLTISSTGGNYKKKITTDVLSARQSVRFDIAPEKIPSGNDKIEISVQSVTNPAFKRTAYVQYIK